MQQEAITKDMIIGEIIEKYPEAAEILSNYGIQCIGCSANPYETLEQGTIGHGMSEQELENLVKELNNLISGKKQPLENIISKDDLSKMSLELTEKAANKIKELMKQQDKEGYGLRVRVQSGGCAGFYYGLDIEKEPDVQKDRIFELHGIKVFIDPKSLQLLNGTTIDYIETLQESGFKFNNPNAQTSCGCGKSFR